MTTGQTPTVGTDGSQNPFEITKAVDFTDQEIDETWVDWPAPGGFAAWMDVNSPMARIIRGGKGSGRTHIMRYFSAQVQTIRGSQEPLKQMLEDGVIGIYVVCSGLNANRFSGRGQNEDTWRTIFPYFADLWLAQAALGAFVKVTERNPPSKAIQRRISDDIRRTLKDPGFYSGDTLTDLTEDLFSLQAEVDKVVNNASLNPSEPLNLVIQASPGTLVFGVPEALHRHYKPLRDVGCLYLIDEFENFDESQQQYINTLVREKDIGTSFMIGVRTYGLRTLATLSAGEENKHGSEFEEIRPDLNYTVEDRKKYSNFCLQIVGRRLSRFGLIEETKVESIGKTIEQFFELPGPQFEEQLIIERYYGRERPYLQRLKSQLSGQYRTSDHAGLDPKIIDFTIDALRVPSRPLLEKANAILLYRAWADGHDLVEKAREIMGERLPIEPSGFVTANEAQKNILEHYATDLKDQLLRDLGRPPIYSGIKDFIAMSDGLPRNLLVVLKNIYRWSMFNEEIPYRGGRISLESQRMGVIEATKWFLADAKPMGEEGNHVIDAIDRLGQTFSRLRFSDKPVECSAASFSADLTSCSARARDIIKIAEGRSLLVQVARGRRQKNTRLVESKFHLNRLLNPEWDLPIGRRGEVSLKPDEVNAIFDPTEAIRFTDVLDLRLQTVNVPFGRRRDDDGLQQRLEFNDLTH